MRIRLTLGGCTGHIGNDQVAGKLSALCFVPTNRKPNLFDR
jgi:hypothetical protein